MNFDDIKRNWKASFDKAGHLSKEQIKARLEIGGKSNNILKKIRKSFRFDIYLGMAIFSFILVFMTIYLKKPLVYYFVPCAAVFFTAIIWFTWSNFKKVKNTTFATDQIRPNLVQTIDCLERFVSISRGNLNKFIIIPFSIILGIFIGISYAAGIKNIELADLILSFGTRTIIKIAVVIFAGSALTIYFSLYVNKKLYNDHLEELRKCLREFEETEERN